MQPSSAVTRNCQIEDSKNRTVITREVNWMRSKQNMAIVKRHGMVRCTAWSNILFKVLAISDDSWGSLRNAESLSVNVLVNETPALK